MFQRVADIMAKVELYTGALCPYCSSAKKLLKNKGVEFQEIDVTFKPRLRKEMTARSGRSSVPQIWINGQHVGGCDDLYALERSGELDNLLAQA